MKRHTSDSSAEYTSSTTSRTASVYAQSENEYAYGYYSSVDDTFLRCTERTKEESFSDAWSETADRTGTHPVPVLRTRSTRTATSVDVSAPLTTEGQGGHWSGCVDRYSHGENDFPDLDTTSIGVQETAGNLQRGTRRCLGDPK